MLKKSLVIASLISCAGLAIAAFNPVKTGDPLLDGAQEACKPDIKKYCDEVTLGDGRLAACLYAHEDKVSDTCAFFIYRVVEQVQQDMQTLNLIADQCIDDIEKNCKGVEPGEGRILKCLDKNEKKVSSNCTRTLKSLGLK